MNHTPNNENRLHNVKREFQPTQAQKSRIYEQILAKAAQTAAADVSDYDAHAKASAKKEYSTIVRLENETKPTIRQNITNAMPAAACVAVILLGVLVFRIKPPQTQQPVHEDSSLTTTDTFRETLQTTTETVTTTTVTSDSSDETTAETDITTTTFPEFTDAADVTDDADTTEEFLPTEVTQTTTTVTSSTSTSGTSATVHTTQKVAATLPRSECDLYIPDAAAKAGEEIVMEVRAVHDFSFEDIKLEARLVSADGECFQPVTAELNPVYDCAFYFLRNAEQHSVTARLIAAEDSFVPQDDVWFTLTVAIPENAKAGDAFSIEIPSASSGSDKAFAQKIYAGSITVTD